jgi:predicted RNase H-like nuclease (RuvC/YqgF family)
VLVVPTAGTTLVYWGPPQVKEALRATEWPRVYRERNERQEHSFKRMIDHGALNTNDGRKKIVGPDRPQQRAREQLDQSRQAAQRRLDKKAEALKTHQTKVAESVSQGHGTRLEQRQHALAGLAKELQESQHKPDSLAGHLAALDPPRQRADRDLRTQTIMTFRTRLLANALMSFMAGLLGHLSMQVSLECLLTILFERSGARMETASQVIYWMNTTGLAVA